MCRALCIQLLQLKQNVINKYDVTFRCLFHYYGKKSSKKKNENNVCTNFRFSSPSKPTGCHSLFSQWELMSSFLLVFGCVQLLNINEYMIEP